MSPSKITKQIAVFLFDAVLVVFSLLLSYALRFNTVYLGAHVNQLQILLPLMLTVRLGIFAFTGLYRGMWRFTGMRDLVSLVKAVTSGTALAVAFLFLAFRLEEYPRSVFIIDWFVILVLAGGSRFSYRLYREGRLKQETEARSVARTVLIVGAGKAGEMILREILGNYRLNYTPVGFVDDDRKKRNMTIHGCRVLGNTREIPGIVKKFGIAEIFLAVPTVSGAAKRRIMLTCKRAGIKTKTLPGVGEILDGSAKVSMLR